MKTITKTFIFLTLIFAYSCAKECDAKKDIYYNVDEVDKNMLPYTGFDTLSFVRTSVGDTHTFIGIGKTANYKRTSLTYDCSAYYFRENYAFTFISSTFNSPLYIGQYIPEVSESLTLSYVNFENIFIENWINFNLTKPDIDSLKVLNKMYYKLEKLGQPINKTAYFDKTNGCIKIEMNNQTWELLEYKK